MVSALDESLSYVCHLSYRTEAASDAALRSTFERVCNAVRVCISPTAESHVPANPIQNIDHNTMQLHSSFRLGPASKTTNQQPFRAFRPSFLCLIKRNTKPRLTPCHPEPYARDA